MQWKGFISSHPIKAACPSSWLCSEALRSCHDGSPNMQQPATVTTSLQQHLQLTSRWNAPSIQLLFTKPPSKQQDTNQLAGNESGKSRNMGVCQSGGSASNATEQRPSHLLHACICHDFHRGQPLEGKAFHASVLQLLFCFLALTQYAFNPIPANTSTPLARGCMQEDSSLQQWRTLCYVSLQLRNCICVSLIKLHTALDVTAQCFCS